LLAAVAGFCPAAAGTTLTAPGFVVAGEGFAAAWFCAAFAADTVVFAAGFSTTVGVCATAPVVNAINNVSVSVRFIKSCLLPSPELPAA
jgi:hypothetical protein